MQVEWSLTERGGVSVRSFHSSKAPIMTAAQLSKWYKFSETQEKVTDLGQIHFLWDADCRGPFSLSEFRAVSEMISGRAHRWRTAFNFYPYQIAVLWVLLLRRVLNRKKINWVNLKTTSFYVDRVKAVRVVCKCLRTGIRERVQGFVLRFILGPHSGFVPHYVWILGMFWFFLILNLPEVEIRCPQGHWALNQMRSVGRWWQGPST